MVETAPWGDDSAAIEKQIQSHNSFHSSIQRSSEVERARDELVSFCPLPDPRYEVSHKAYVLAQRLFFKT